MAESKPSLLSDKELKEFLAPIELGPTSGDWVSAKDALALFAEKCGVGEEEAKRALCRRAVIIVPVSCLMWSASEDPHDFINRFEYFSNHKRKNQHFLRTLDRTSWAEIRHFFEALESGSDKADCWNIEASDWATGDFKIRLEKDFSSVCLSVVGLRFDKVAIEQSLVASAANPILSVGDQSKTRGRRPKYDWPAATLAVFGRIHRGDFKPESQADIERALIEHLADETGGPSESTVRPYAKLIWTESQKA